MHPRLMTTLILLAAFFCAACAGGSGSPGLEQGGINQHDMPAFDIPAPAEAAKAVQSTTQDRIRSGKHYVPGMAQGVSGESTWVGNYTPAYNGTDSFAVAYGIYAYTLNDYSAGNAINLKYYYQGPVPESGTVFVGLSDFISNSWRWYAVDDAGRAATGNIVQLLNEHNELYVAVVAIGDQPFNLGSVMVGDGNPPVAVPSASTTLFLSDTAVDFSGSASLSYNHAITLYEWDFDDDGVFEETGEVVNGKLFAPGLHKVTLRITDQADLTGSGFIWVQSVDAGDPPDYVEVEDNDSMEAAQQLPGQKFYDFSGNLGQGGVNDGDTDDWFKFDLPTHGALGARLKNNFAEVDLGIELLNANGVVLASSDTESDEELVLVMSLAAGSYYIHCYASGEGSGDYGLEVETLYGVAPIALMFGSETNIVQGGSLTLNASQSYDADDEIDHFEWDLYGDGHFESMSDTDSVILYINIMRVGTFTARVKVVDERGFWSFAEWEYTVGGDQQFDEMEDNDTAFAAQVWSWFPESNFATFVGDIGEGGGWDGDTEDWYEFELTEAGDLQFICAPLDADHGGLNLYLIDGDGILVAGDNSENEVKGIQNSETLDPGTYYVLIESAWGSTRYDMSGHFTPEV